MTVLINTDEILYNIRKIAHNELRIAIPDETVRYIVEPGSEKDDELKLLVAESFEELHEAVGRFLLQEGTETGYEIDNSGNELPEKFRLDFAVSERRVSSGRLATIGQKCFSFLSQKTLAKYYDRVAQSNLAQAHERVAGMDSQTILKTLYIKLPPVI